MTHTNCDCQACISTRLIDRQRQKIKELEETLSAHREALTWLRDECGVKLGSSIEGMIPKSAQASKPPKRGRGRYD